MTAERQTTLHVLVPRHGSKCISSAMTTISKRALSITLLFARLMPREHGCVGSELAGYCTLACESPSGGRAHPR